MALDEEKIRKELDALFHSVKTIENLNNIRFKIDDYIEDGYSIRDYIKKYNSFAYEFTQCK
jgi:hypothetical protein